ncbi:MAG: hypothetical protein Fur0042_16750 [Cyanophyceae cyanobacterium]
MAQPWILAAERLRRLCFDARYKNLSAAMAIAYGAGCGGLALGEAFAGAYVIQDDARQYGFWMRRFLDPALFPQDWTAEYLANVTPDVYALPFWLAAQVGIDPLVLQKVMPLFLGVLVAVLAWRLAWRWLPVPIAALAASILLSQSLWMKDDLASAAPRAWVYPLLLGFLEAYGARSLPLVLGMVALLAWMSPPYAAIAIAILALDCLRLGRWRLGFNGDRRAWLWFGLGLGIAIAILVPYLVGTGQFGPTISADVARTMAEFRGGGRASVFDQDFWDYWFFGKRTNLFPRSLLTPVTLILGLALPFLMVWRRNSDLLKHHLNPAIGRAMVQLIVGSIGLYGLAHATLFSLHLPSRYTGHSFRIAIALAAGVGLTLVLEKLWSDRGPNQSPLRQGSAVLLLVILFAYPLSVSDFPLTGYRAGQDPNLYEFLQQQPKDTLTVSLSKIADNIPPFAARSVYFAPEYAIPYHRGYYQEIQRRARATIAAQYARDRVIVLNFLQTSGADYWLLDHNAFDPTYLDDGFRRQFQPAAAEAQAFLEQGGTPWLMTQRDRCTAIAAPTWHLLSAACLTSPSP